MTDVDWYLNQIVMRLHEINRLVHGSTATNAIKEIVAINTNDIEIDIHTIIKKLKQQRDHWHEARCNAIAAGEVLKEQRDDLLAFQDKTLSQLSRLLTSYAPQCEPLPDMMGVVMQIDNLLCGRNENVK